MIFLTSDTHFGHRGIIDHCGRPFSSVEEMDAALIKAWNKAVRPSDTIYHLGDFAWHKRRSDLVALLDSLNGTKHLICGNHDHAETRRLPWASVQYAMRLKVAGVAIYLSHYPVVGFREDLHFHGHQHNKTAFNLPHQVDVGVEAWGYCPVYLDEVLAAPECILRQRKPRPA